MNSKPKNLSELSEFFKQKDQRIWLASVAVFYILIFFVLKHLYPYPDTISDSGGYLHSAFKNQFTGYRPFGYSKFLIILHSISDSIGFVYLVQYIMNALATTFFLLTIKYHFKLKTNWITLLLDFLAISSIAVLYLTVAMLSDSVFASLTILWITLSIWSISTKKIVPSALLFAIKIILLVFIINLRFTGLFYLGIEAIFVLYIFIKKQPVFALISVIIIIITGAKIINTQTKKTKEFSGVEVFAGFSGWQKANNALHALPYVDINTRKIRDKKLRAFVSYAKSADSLLILDNLEVTASYLWDKNMPLKRYLVNQIHSHKWTYIKTWTYLGKEVYNDFGSYMMKEHTGAYIRYFLFPNALGCLYPTNDQVYFKYNGSHLPPKIVDEWYGISEDEKFYSRSEIVGKFSKTISVSTLIYWISVVSLIVYFFIKKGSKILSKEQFSAFLLIGIFTLSYLAFYIYAAPFEVRYISAIRAMQIVIIYIVMYTIIKSKSIKN